MELNKIYNMDCLEGMKQMEDNSVDLVITSPPYNTGDRDDCMINAKYVNFNDNKTEDEYINWTIKIFKELNKKLKKTGVICYNLSYSTKLCNYLLKLYSKKRDTILDPFIGSGTTAVACVELERNFIGFEISKEYCDIANQRIKKAQSQDKLKKWF
jgi:DNA modification methylase